MKQQINVYKVLSEFKTIFSEWISRSEKVDAFVKEMREPRF